jgi:hypothetical protein
MAGLDRLGSLHVSSESGENLSGAELCRRFERDAFFCKQSCIRLLGLDESYVFRYYPAQSYSKRLIPGYGDRQGASRDVPPKALQRRTT